MVPSAGITPSAPVGRTARHSNVGCRGNDLAMFDVTAYADQNLQHRGGASLAVCLERACKRAAQAQAPRAAFVEQLSIGHRAICPTDAETLKDQRP